MDDFREGEYMTSNLTKQEKIEKQDQRINKILWIPLVLLLGFVPLIMRMLVINPTDESVIDALNTTEIIDIYSNFKATAIVVLCVAMLVMLFLVFDRQKLKFDKTIKWYFIGGGLFIGITLIATILSKHPSIAWWGMPDRAEGFVMTACYVLMMGYTLYSLRDYRSYTYIIGSLGFLVIISTIIGVFQYFGYDLFTKVDFFKNLILSSEAKALGASVASEFESGKVFGTMFHYNYMGSFGAMMVPFFLTLTLFIRNKWQKLFCSVISLCAMFLLFGSTSRAGVIGLVLAIFIGLIIFGKQFIDKWKVILPVLMAFVIVLFGFNFMTDGRIFSRIPTLITESIGLFSSSDESFDYKDHIPVREIVHEDGKEKIVFQTDILYIGNEDNNPVFIDGQGNQVEYTLSVTGTLADLSTVYTTKDERFNKVAFSYAKLSGIEEGVEPPVVLEMTYNGLKAFNFMLDSEKGVVLADSCPLQEMEIDYPETIGFKGKEKLGSARGYIWSRSLPMLKKTLLVGYGPDTYALEFPQNDLLGKWWAYGTPNMIIDKVHNLYLAIFINNGGLALLGFFIMLGAYLIQSFKLYALKGYYENKEILGIATTLAIVGYLGAGIFNDSVVSVAPIFWILLGAGMGVNYLVNKEESQIKERISKVVPIRK